MLLGYNETEKMKAGSRVNPGTIRDLLRPPLSPQGGLEYTRAFAGKQPPKFPMAFSIRIHKTFSR
jgi:hypothetical protein